MFTLFTHITYRLKLRLSRQQNYGLPVTAIVQAQNKIGIQFHPEKSGDYGLEILNQALKGGFIDD